MSIKESFEAFIAKAKAEIAALEAHFEKAAPTVAPVEAPTAPTAVQTQPPATQVAPDPVAPVVDANPAPVAPTAAPAPTGFVVG